MKFNAKSEAGLRVAVMLERVRLTEHTRPGVPLLISLSDYADEDTFNFLLIKPGWTFAQWHAVNEECIRLLQAEGFTVNRVKLDMDGFFTFLARYNLGNKPQNRAQYVAWAQAPEPKPEPLRD